MDTSHRYSLQFMLSFLGFWQMDTLFQYPIIIDTARSFYGGPAVDLRSRLSGTNRVAIQYFFSYTAQSESQLTWQRKGVYAWQAQLVLVYFFGGLGKAMGPTWWNGEAIWKAVQQPFPGNLIDIPLSWGNWTICWGMMGIGIVLLELGYVLAWIGTMYRRIIYIAAIAMHLSIALTIGLYHFSALMIWYNLCAWYYPYRRQTSIPIHNSSLGYADTDAAGTVRPASIQYKERR